MSRPSESCMVDFMDTTTNESNEIKNDNLVIMAACIQRHCIGVATYISEVAEISIFDSMQGQFLEDELQSLHLALSSHSPDVLLIGENVNAELRSQLQNMTREDCKIVLVKPWWFKINNLEKNIDELWLSGMPQDFTAEERRNYIFSLLPVAASDEVLGSLGALLSVIYAQKLLGTVEVLSGESLHMLQSLSQFNLKERVQFDLPTLSALQIFSSDKHPSNFISNSKEGLSLYALLDHCHTLQGKRMLKNWLLNPITNIEEIERRLGEVNYLLDLPSEVLSSIQSNLSSIRSLPSVLKQVISRQGSGGIDKAHLKLLHKSLVNGVELIQSCSQILQWRVPHIEVASIECVAELNLSEAIELLTAMNKTLGIHSESTEEEDIFFVSPGVSSNLDELKRVYVELPNILNSVIEKELQRIPSALVRKHEKTEWALLHLPQFGFVIKMASRLSPDLSEVFFDYSYVSDFCKNFFLYKSTSTSHLDNQFGDLHRKIQDLETAILSQFTFEILQVHFWQELIEKTAKLDVMLSLASVARAYNLRRPQVVNENVLKIRNGRHILNEQTVKGSFIPNDTDFLQDSERVHVITGPNFSGKTVYAKQIALITWMSHVGSYVPADEAVIGVCDRIMTRLDSIDASSVGQSSFMMDLAQVLNTLRNSTSRSLILLDEFGRGTESSDGFGLFFSILTAFADKPYPPRIIACTHFNCAMYLQHVPKNVHVTFNKMECFIEEAVDKGDHSEVIYLYRLVKGICTDSFGIFCARKAGLQVEICRRALAFQDNSKFGLSELHDINHSIQQSLEKKLHTFLNLDLLSTDFKTIRNALLLS